jgi:hypothetical protein
MGMIINIDEALKLRSDYNILQEPLHKMMQDQQEAWEKENPIDFIFARGTLGGFQETYTSSIGFEHAFAETSDYAVGPIFNTAEGFSATYRTRTFQGGFIISQQVLEDGQMRRIKDDASAFVKRWHGDIVEYAIAGLAGGFGEDAYFTTGEGKSRIRLMSADTVDGDPMNTAKNPLFFNKHTTVKRDDNAQVIHQSNLFYVADEDLAIGGDDAGQISKLADVINQVITIQENLRDDNGKRAGVMNEKTIVTGNDAHLKAALSTALSTDIFAQGETKVPNPAKNRATLKTSPYYLDIDMCKDGNGFFVVDKPYNEDNHGLEFTERVPFTLNAFEKKEAPMGIKYEGRQRFDINCATWRGISYVRLGTPGNGKGWDNIANYTRITPTATIVKPVTVIGTVATKEQA